MNPEPGKAKRIANILVVVLLVLFIIIAIAIAQRQPKAQLPVHDANGITHGAASTPADSTPAISEQISTVERFCKALYRQTYNEKQSNLTVKQVHEIGLCQQFGLYHDVE
jgi:hypothetical protein